MTLNHLVVGSSPTRVTTADRVEVGVGVASRVFTPVCWIEAPEWLTLQEAAFLSGFDDETLGVVIAEGGVDLNYAGLIAKDSLYEYREALWEVYAGYWG